MKGIGYFLGGHDTRRALNGLKGHCREWSVEPLSEAVQGRSWCLTGLVSDPSEQVTASTIIGRWSGKIIPGC